MRPSSARARQLRLSSGCQTLEAAFACAAVPTRLEAFVSATSLSSRATFLESFFGSGGSAGFDFAHGRETEFSLAGLDDVEPPLWPGVLSAEGSEQSLECASAAGSALGGPSGTANSNSGTPCDTAFCTPNCGTRGVVGAGLWLSPGAAATGSPVLIAATVSICNCAVDWPALTVMNTLHGPTLPAEGMIDAVPS